MSSKVKVLILIAALALTFMITGNSSYAGAYLYENVTVVGRSEINDSFQMVNIRPGSEVKDSFNIDDIFGSSSLDGVNLNPGNDLQETGVAPSSTEVQKNSNQTVVLPATIDRNNLNGADNFLLERVFSSYSWWRLF